MKSAPLPLNEQARLAALEAFGVLDTDFEKDYDDLCQLAATICGTPIALISLIDQDRQWFKASVGLDVRETTRDIAFCSHAIWENKIFEVPDALADERFFDNPLVTGKPDIRFYAGQPLITNEGLAIGTLCAIDRVPRTLEPDQRKALDILARQVVTHLELRRAMVDLKKLNADKDRFFSVIAHDLRSPFSGLLGLVDLIQDRGTSMEKDEILELMGLVHQSLHGVYDFSENLLKWAMLEQGKMSFQSESIAVSVLFDEALAPLTGSLEGKSLSLMVRPPAPDLAVTGDRNMLETALRNVISNAAKFTPRAGSITLSAVQEGGKIRISVADTGIGMSPQQVEALRSGYQTVSRPGTEKETGTGLGLTLVRQFVARNSGGIEIQSTEGVGTTVTLILPS